MRKLDGFIPAVGDIFDTVGPEVEELTFRVKRPTNQFIRTETPLGGFNRAVTNYQIEITAKLLDGEVVEKGRVYENCEFELMVLLLTGTLDEKLAGSREYSERMIKRARELHK